MIISQKKGSDLFEPLFADIVGSMYGKLVDAYGKKKHGKYTNPMDPKGKFSFPVYAAEFSCQDQFM